MFGRGREKKVSARGYIHPKKNSVPDEMAEAVAASITERENATAIRKENSAEGNGPLQKTHPGRKSRVRHVRPIISEK